VLVVHLRMYDAWSVEDGWDGVPYYEPRCLVLVVRSGAINCTLSSQQAPTAGVSLTTRWTSFAPLHHLLTALALGPKVVGSGCSGEKLVHHVVSDTLAGGACGDESGIQAVMWHAGYASGSSGTVCPAGGRLARGPIEIEDFCLWLG
jgi:hypothetical protein